MDDHFKKAVGECVSSLLISTISNVGHDNTASLELSTDAGINTLGPTPAFLQISKVIGSTDGQDTENQTLKRLKHTLNRCLYSKTLQLCRKHTLTAILRSH